MKQLFKLVNQDVRRRCLEAIKAAPEGFVVKISEPSRTLDQNAAQWPILQAFAKQKQLCVNGKMEFVSDEEWKDVLTAAHREELARVASYGGKMIILCKRTSKFSKQEFSDWLEWLNASAVIDGIDLDH